MKKSVFREIHSAGKNPEMVYGVEEFTEETKETVKEADEIIKKAEKKNGRKSNK